MPLALTWPGVIEPGKASNGGCETNANQSQFSQSLPGLRRAEATPLRKSRGAVEFEFVATVEMAFLVEMVVN